jgi:hypothetical protein
VTSPDWTRHPDQWPHTPPLGAYRELIKKNPVLVMLVGHGHQVNLLEEAIDALERVEKLHHEYQGVCTHCVDPRNPPTQREAWPCETVRILAGGTDG